MADYIRKLPEYLQEDDGFDSRIMMPRYGIISERRNRLHEVIRLSGTKIEVGDEAELLKVKVASIPGIRLQVYFMDSVKYFKRKGIYQDRKKEVMFTDSPERAVFFARSVFETTKNLGWGPDIIHAHGWMSALIPVLLHTEYADDPLFKDTRVVYSSDGVKLDERLTKEQVENWGLPSDERLTSLDVAELGPAFADAVVNFNGTESPVEGAIDLEGSPEDVTGEIAELYNRLHNESHVPA